MSEPGTEAAAAREAPEERQRRRWLPLLLVFFVIIVLAVAGWYYWRSRKYVSTDNAFIEGTVVQVSPRVAGQLLNVYVDDNQTVAAGDLLVELDPQPYQFVLDARRAAVRLAEARLDAATVAAGMTVTTTGAGLGQAEAALDAAQRNADRARASVEAAEAEQKRTQADVVRYRRLEESVVSRQLREQAEAAARVAAARLDEAREQLSAAEAQVVAAQNQVQAAQTAPQQVEVSQYEARQRAAELTQARAALSAAELDLTYTKVYAPIAGSVAQKNADAGEFVNVGQVLMAVVSRDVWVVANFKETQLTRMRPGQTVSIEIDAYPNLELSGYVDSIQAGSGARFSLLPPQNATGNYVKVVQRVPVKMIFSEALPRDIEIAPGMSVVPTVRVTK